MALSPLELHLAAVAAFGVVCFLVGYGVGGQRVFNFLGYGSESLLGVFRTMLPNFGRRRKL